MLTAIFILTLFLMWAKCERTLNVFHDHAQVPPRLKGAEHGDDKRVFCEGEDVPLHKSLLYLVSQDQVLLVDLLHGKSLTRLSVAHQVDSPEEKVRQRRENFYYKVLQSGLRSDGKEKLSSEQFSDG